MNAKQAAQDVLDHAVRAVFVTIAHEHAFTLAQVAGYLEELGALHALDDLQTGAWALTLRQALGTQCPPKVGAALEALADAVAVLEALELEADAG
jgi:hypothetical protein